ncbi:MAG: hypothetical protein NTV01_17515 [Bacteroidia bacterium]|nr:hypothetical protein [Bacteroidia bacterium]
MNIKHLATLLIGVLMIGMVSCEYVTIEPNDSIVVPAGVLFSAQIQPIFTDANCTSCHPALHQPDFAAGKAWSSLTTGNFVNTTTPKESLLYIQITTNDSHKNFLTANQKALILKWIEEGAKNN